MFYFLNITQMCTDTPGPHIGTLTENYKPLTENPEPSGTQKQLECAMLHEGLQKVVMISRDNIKDKCPIPQYVTPHTNIILEIYDNGKIIKATGFCTFPSKDPTINSRGGRINHFHGNDALIELIKIIMEKVIKLMEDTSCALNVVWNAARAGKEAMDWDDMVSVVTETRAFKPLNADQSYHFNVGLELMKGHFKTVKLEILDEDETKVFTVKTKVIIDETKVCVE